MKLTVIGTGLVGASVALAAQRAGVESVRGWDEDAAALGAAAGLDAVEPADSLAAAVAGADLVVVAVPVDALADRVGDALAAAPEATREFYADAPVNEMLSRE